MVGVTETGWLRTGVSAQVEVTWPTMMASVSFGVV